jgi:hypothetical protein
MHQANTRKQSRKKYASSKYKKAVPKEICNKQIRESSPEGNVHQANTRKAVPKGICIKQIQESSPERNVHQANTRKAVLKEMCIKQIQESSPERNVHQANTRKHSRKECASSKYKKAVPKGRHSKAQGGGREAAGTLGWHEKDTSPEGAVQSASPFEGLNLYAVLYPRVSAPALRALPPRALLLRAFSAGSS